MIKPELAQCSWHEPGVLSLRINPRARNNSDPFCLLLDFKVKEQLETQNS